MIFMDRSIAATANKSVFLLKRLSRSGLFFKRVWLRISTWRAGRYMNIRTKFNLPDLAGDLLDNGGPLCA